MLSLFIKGVLRPLPCIQVRGDRVAGEEGLPADHQEVLQPDHGDRQPHGALLRQGNCHQCGRPVSHQDDRQVQLTAT